MFMGLITYFKRKFAKDIVVNGDITHHLIFVYKLKKGRIWLASNIEVPENFAFAICSAGKIYDTFPAGYHSLTGINLPKCVKKFNLTRQLKDGSIPDSFVADAYFINMNLFEYVAWKAYRKPELYDEKYGYFNFMLSGGFAFKIINANKFLQTVLKVYDYLRQGEAQDILSGLVSEYIVGEIEKNSYDYALVSDKEALTDRLFENMHKKFMKMGVEILGLSVEKTKFSKKLKDKIQKEILQKQDYSQFGSNITKQQENAESQIEYAKNNKRKVKKLTEPEKQVINEEKQQSKFVDLDDISSYNKQEQSVRCKFCGAKNSSEAENCKLCGETLNEGVVLDE